MVRRAKPARSIEPENRANGPRSAPARRHPKGCGGPSAGAAVQPPGWAVLKGVPQGLRGPRPRAAPAALSPVGVLAPRPRLRSGKCVRRAARLRLCRCGWRCAARARRRHLPERSEGPQGSPALAGKWG